MAPSHSRPSSTTMTEERWRRRPLLSALVRFLTVATPIVASVATAVLMSRLLPVPGETMGLACGWGATLLASTVALLAVDRLARRLLPLAVLLNLSMVFPDKAPDRFWTAFRAGTIGHLEERLAQARRTGLRDEPAEAAHTIIELISAITVHDRRTRGHSERVRAFNDLIAEALHLS